MIDIVFRGKRADNNEWVKGNLIRYLNGQSAILEIGGLKIFSVIPSTVGQYIRRTDKNGKRIFEGDIVDVVHFGNETWRCVVSDIRSIPAEMCGGRVKSMGVVGNIHDNPELLRGGAE